jgi:hypothetical protein
MRAIARLIVASSILCSSTGLVHASETDANVNGSYGFRFNGYDNAVSKNFIVGTGEFIANGKGIITGGSITYNDGGNVCKAALVRSAYSVLADGEGTLTLAFTGVSPPCLINPSFTFAIALAQPSSTNVAQVVQMNTISVEVNATATAQVMAAGVANLL